MTSSRFGNHFGAGPTPQRAKPNESNFLRSQSNLSYLQFIRLVERVWAEAHPEIPIVPRGTSDPATYPVMVYHLDSRRAHPSEPKIKYREAIKPEDSNETSIIAGQRFQNIITFTAVASISSSHEGHQGVHTAEQLIEVFEDFMLEFTGLFKKCGYLQSSGIKSSNTSINCSAV